MTVAGESGHEDVGGGWCEDSQWCRYFSSYLRCCYVFILYNVFSNTSCIYIGETKETLQKRIC